MFLLLADDFVFYFTIALFLHINWSHLKIKAIIHKNHKFNRFQNTLLSWNRVNKTQDFFLKTYKTLDKQYKQYGTKLFS